MLDRLLGRFNLLEQVIKGHGIHYFVHIVAGQVPKKMNINAGCVI